MIRHSIGDNPVAANPSTDQANSKSRSSKLGVVALFVLLIGLPAGSWYYLQKGFSYSKDVYDETSAQGSIDSLGVTLIPIGFRQDSLEGKAYVLIDANRVTGLDNLEKIQKQFDTNPNFLVISQSKQNDPGLKKLALQEYALGADYDMATMDPDNDIWLIDRDGYIRHKYDSREEDIWRSMVRHLAFVVPKVRRDQLSIKRK